MSTCETFEDLQALGTEKIHEKTHISRDKVELILNKSYSNIGQVQFMGFMSILEREFGVDLGDIRREYMDYWQEHAAAVPPKQSAILQPPSNTKQKQMALGGALIVLLLVGGYLLQSILSNEPREEVMTLSTVPVNPLNETNMSAAPDANGTAESNQTVMGSEANSSAVAGGKTVTIRPVQKVWTGMIDMASGAKTQQITGDPIVIDTSKNWLIVFGHGQLEIETPQGKQLLNGKDTVRFIYENGSFKQLSKAEFAERNGGKNW